MFSFTPWVHPYLPYLIFTSLFRSVTPSSRSASFYFLLIFLHLLPWPLLFTLLYFLPLLSNNCPFSENNSFPSPSLTLPLFPLIHKPSYIHMYTYPPALVISVLYNLYVCILSIQLAVSFNRSPYCRFLKLHWLPLTPIFFLRHNHTAPPPQRGGNNTNHFVKQFVKFFFFFSHLPSPPPPSRQFLFEVQYSILSVLVSLLIN